MHESCGRHREETRSSWARRPRPVARSRDCWFVPPYVVLPDAARQGSRARMAQRTRSHGDRTCYVVQADLCMQAGAACESGSSRTPVPQKFVKFSVGHPPIRLDHLPHARGVELTQGVEGVKQLTPNSGRQSSLRNPPQDFTDIPSVHDGYLSGVGVRRDPLPVSASDGSVAWAWLIL